MVKYAKKCFNSDNRNKQAHTDQLKSTCELLIDNQKSFLSWLISNHIFSNDELSRLFYNLDNQVIKLAAQFYSDSVDHDYIRFQTMATKVVTDRLRFNISTQVPSVQLQLTLKTYHSAYENLLLSLRIKQSYADAQAHLREVYTFLRETGQEHEPAEVEWLVTNWCKIKRDMTKSKTYTYSAADKKLSIADYLSLATPELAYHYLYEEIKFYTMLKMSDSSFIMTEEIYNALCQMNSLCVLGTIRIFNDLKDSSMKLFK